jgi:hypothetical protein
LLGGLLPGAIGRASAPTPAPGDARHVIPIQPSACFAAPAAGTAIADLDADDAADIATACRDDGSRYEVRVELSRGTEEVFSFRSPQPLLTLVAYDIDGDHDLDLIAEPAFSDEIVAVWLNDGQGRFTATNPDGFPRRLPASRVAASSFLRPTTLSLVSVPSPRRPFAARTAAVPFLIPPPDAGGGGRPADHTPPSPVVWSASPRAPPSSPLPLLN